MPQDQIVSTVFVSNLHCSSCVHTIETALIALSPQPYNVEVSIVSHAVTIYHPESLTRAAIQSALEDAGFDVVGDPANRNGEPGPTTLSSLFHGKREKHLQQCTMCQEEYGTSDQPEAARGISEVPTQPTSPIGPFTVVLSVGGMTCSSCVNSITEMALQVIGVSEVSVSLIDKSVTAIIASQDLAQKLADTIEDCGFEAQVVSVDPRIDGMFCQNCPTKLTSALVQFGSAVEVVKPPQGFNDPLITSPPFNVSTHQPPSLEQLARRIHAREQRRLMTRLILSVIIAIPTFIIGIVYMTLVKSDDPIKEYLMEPMWAGNASRTEWALFFLATPVYFYSASLFHKHSIKELSALWRRGSPIPILRRFIRFGSMNLLVSSAVSVAYFASIALLALAASQSPMDHGMAETTSYFDSVVFLTMFLLAGRVVEAYSKARTADAITALGSLRPSEALLLTRRSTEKGTDEKGRFSIDDDLEKAESTNGSEAAPPGVDVEKVLVSLLEVGDIVRVPHGATPPADGVLVAPFHDGLFDESSLTGESRLIKKQEGDSVFLGTINKGNMVHVRVGFIGGETMLDRIVNVVREGQTRRAPIERVADMITGYFVPVVTFLAISTWLIWLILGLTGSLPEDYLDIPIGGWPVWSLGFAIAVFVVACPCGIGLAAPTALLVGSGLAAKHGILARGGGEAFQEMAQVDLVVFDKTGTLTEGGDPKVSDVLILPDAEKRWSRETVLGIAGELESASSHPLAIAIRSHAKSAKARQVVGDMFSEQSGRGMKARFPSLGCTAVIGNEAWMAAHEVNVDVGVLRQLAVWRSEAKSVVLLAFRDDDGGEQREDGSAPTVFQLAAIFAVADPLRAEAPRVISWLQARGIQTWIISGDNETTAIAVAQAVGIPASNVIAGVLPHEKAEKVTWLQQNAAKKEVGRWRRLRSKTQLNERCIVAMVGDGINDAPALTAADIGVAIGSGSDVAISSASFILLSSDLRSLITLYHLSRRVFNRVIFNFFWAAIYNVAAIPIAAGVIYPAGHVRLDPVWASLAMALS
ncbi:hypothetical protein ONZ45_g465 [Pleurotus djamor]|nr:hypothetical protein ONZ45_g465 [Pleurotus djamor]